MKKIIYILIFITCSLSQNSEIDSLLTDEPIKKPARSILYSMALPGAGQYYNESYTKSALYFSLFSFFLYESHRYNLEHKELKSYFNSSVSVEMIPEEYRLTVDGLTTKNITLLAKERKDSVNKRNRAIWRMLGVYTLSVLDAWAGAYLFRFDDLMGTEKAKFNIDHDIENGVKVNFSYHF